MWCFEITVRQFTLRRLRLFIYCNRKLKPDMILKENNLHQTRHCCNIRQCTCLLEYFSSWISTEIDKNKQRIFCRLTQTSSFEWKWIYSRGKMKIKSLAPNTRQFKYTSVLTLRRNNSEGKVWTSQTRQSKLSSQKNEK